METETSSSGEASLSQNNTEYSVVQELDNLPKKNFIDGAILEQDNGEFKVVDDGVIYWEDGEPYFSREGEPYSENGERIGQGITSDLGSLYLGRK